MFVGLIMFKCDKILVCTLKNVFPFVLIYYHLQVYDGLCVMFSYKLSSEPMGGSQVDILGKDVADFDLEYLSLRS